MGLGLRGIALVAFLVSPALARPCTDSTGQMHAEADFVSLDDGVVSFRTLDGEERRCDLCRLSLEDQAYVQELDAELLAVFDLATAILPVFAESASAGKLAEQIPAPAERIANPVEKAANPAVPPVSETLTSAAHNSASCQPECAPALQTYQCTVMVPEMVTEMRTIKVCEWRTEQRQGTYTACRMVPETHSVTYEYTVPSYEQRTREFVYSVFKPVLSTVQRNYTVMVPHAEKRQSVRQECRLVPVEMTRTVCEDHGCWQQIVQNQDSCCCSCCPQVCNVWAPKLERREVRYTVMRPETYSVPYEYDVTVCKPERRTENVQVCNYVPEQQKCSVPYTVCVPVKKTGTREVTNWRLVQEQKSYTYSACIPYPVEKQLAVQVCRMVPKTVTYQRPICPPVSCW